MIYHIWQFVSVALEKNERKQALIFGPVSFIFFIAGISFGYLIIMPIGLRFLLGFSTDFILPMVTISKYISFVGFLTLSFGLIFELPLAMLFLARIGMVTPQFFSDRRRQAIVIVFIAAALLTPPDIVTQCLMAVPLLVLYEIGVLFAKLGYRRHD